MTAKLFIAARGIAPPRTVASVGFDESAKTLPKATLPGVQKTMKKPKQILLHSASLALALLMLEPCMAAEELNDEKPPAKNAKEVAAVSKTPDAIELEAITVVGKSGGYNVTNSSAATKTDTPIFDTPASIHVVPRAVLDDQQAVRLQDTYRNVSGVYALPFVGDFSDDFIIRGFAQDRTVFRDGFRLRGTSPNLTNVESVEVLKGPVGMLYGRLEPGGMINLTTKRPLATPYYSVQQQIGSHDLYRTTLDATGPLLDSGALLYRVNFEYLDEGSPVDFVFGERLVAAPSLTWHLSESTQVDFDYSYQDHTVRPFEGVPVRNGKPLDLPRSRFLGEPTDRSEDVSHEGSVTLTHTFDSNWKVRGRVSAFEQDVLFQASDPTFFDESTGLLDRGLFVFDDQRSHRFGTADLTGHFETGDWRHTLLIGADYYKTDFDEVATGGALPTPIDVFNPRYRQDAIAPVLDTTINPPFFATNVENWWGIYVQDQIDFSEQWHVLIGARYDDSHAESHFETPGIFKQDVAVDDKEFSYRFGLLYQPLPWLAVFGSYVNAFTSSNEFAVLAGDAVPEPERGEQFEAGLKGQWMDNRLSASLVYFHLEKQNTPVAHSDPALALLGLNELAGIARSQGVELDVQGQITDSWKLTANYAYTDAQFTKDRDDSGGIGLQGKRLKGVPRHGANIWSEHDLAKFGLPGVSASWGARFVGGRFGNDENDFRLPGYGLLDLALAYEKELSASKMTLRLNVNNVFDKKYYETSSLSFFRFALPGDPITVMGSVALQW